MGACLISDIEWQSQSEAGLLQEDHLFSLLHTQHISAAQPLSVFHI